MAAYGGGSGAYVQRGLLAVVLQIAILLSEILHMVWRLSDRLSVLISSCVKLHVLNLTHYLLVFLLALLLYLRSTSRQHWSRRRLESNYVR